MKKLDEQLLKDLNESVSEGNSIITKVILFQNFDNVSIEKLDILDLTLNNINKEYGGICETTLKTLVECTENEIHCANTLYDIYKNAYVLRYTESVDKAITGISIIISKCMKEIQNESKLYYIESLYTTMTFKTNVSNMDIFNFINYPHKDCRPYYYFLGLSKLLFKSKEFEDNFKYIMSLIYHILEFSTKMDIK